MMEDIVLKKIGMLISVLVICVSFFGMINMCNKEENNSTLYQSISVEQFIQNILSPQETYVYFYQNSCNACSSFKSVLNSVIEQENVNIYAINFDDIGTEDEKLIKNYGIKVTPTMIVFEEGKELRRSEGYIDVDELITFLFEK